ncbi:hypothetical protein SOM61_09695 [Massilia sp. CFBP9012]|uniref:hypothetical protein n=1 Tax=Massilia sp. CFBP9012 TaxID=3096531 RepID=UPI002A6B667E|nr:hypothetical protein [Massilia sp. CFBP9012]MDY0975237.1 hypothetical protein [Massilia sp. CFBP9012]
MIPEISFKDRSLLLLTGLVAAGAAWAFWHYLGKNAFAVLTIIAIVTLSFDNRRLRRQLGDKPPSGPEQH